MRLSCLSSLLACVACTEPSTDDLFAPSGGDGGASATNGPTTATGTDTTAVTTGDPSTTTGDPSTTTGDPTTTTSTSQSSSTGDPPDVMVDCGEMKCSVEDDGACCFVYNQIDSELSCVDNGNACQAGVAQTAVDIHCQVPSDCETGVCCAHREFDSGSAPYESTRCESSCQYPDLLLCEGIGSPCPNIEPGDGNSYPSICKASTLLPPGQYFVCGTQ